MTTKAWFVHGSASVILARVTVPPPLIPRPDVPSVYIPHRSPAYQARLDRFDSGLKSLCAVQVEGKPVSQRTIAKVCGCSQMRVWVIEKRARRKLQARLRSIGITKRLFSARGLALDLA